jgi:hypothetical protein
VQVAPHFPALAVAWVMAATHLLHRDHLPVELRLVQVIDAFGGLFRGGHSDEAVTASPRTPGIRHHLGTHHLKESHTVCMQRLHIQFPRPPLPMHRETRSPGVQLKWQPRTGKRKQTEDKLLPALCHHVLHQRRKRSK